MHGGCGTEEARPMSSPTLDGAYERCRRIHACHGRSYYLATLMLPRWKRRHVHALYGFTRYADELVDDMSTGLAPAERAARLAALRERRRAGPCRRPGRPGRGPGRRPGRAGAARGAAVRGRPGPGALRPRRAGHRAARAVLAAVRARRVHAVPGDPGRDRTRRLRGAADPGAGAAAAP